MGRHKTPERTEIEGNRALGNRELGLKSGEVNWQFVPQKFDRSANYPDQSNQWFDDGRNDENIYNCRVFHLPDTHRLW